jgi:UDP-galactopyranose mutase
MYDYIIVGAGLAGAVVAERVSTVLGKRVLILEKRDHIGGNCYDEVDAQSGVLVHRYGPHLLHTDSKKVYEYLSEFTSWQEYRHKVLAHVDGKDISIPFNFHTLYQVFSKERAFLLEQKLLELYGRDKKVPILELIKSRDKELKVLGEYIYEKIFVNYTAKQWGKKPEEIDASVTARVPVLTSYDERYFTDSFQVVPKDGYTKLFKNLLLCKNITISLGVEAREFLKLDGDKILFKGREFGGKVIYTGEIDELFDYKYGFLSYRSLDLEFEVIDREFFQKNSVINYPNQHRYTRITEFKHIHPVKSDKTTILKEYPKPYEKGKDIPFYPLFTDENRENYLLYKELAQNIPQLYMIGRLAEFRYYDMDDIVLRALDLFESELKS